MSATSYSLPSRAPDCATARYLRAKRAVDVVLAFVGLVVLAPVLGVVAVMVRATSRGPAIFRQERIGRDGRTFEILKFRTMRLGAELDDHDARAMIVRELAGEQQPIDGTFKPAEDRRITPLGRWLRRTSIDELPQLWNVLRGEMSLVGPRPALAWEHELFPEAARARVLAPPGLTGLWQVSGRSAVDTRTMLAIDLEYLATRSFALDLRILVRTVFSIAHDGSTR